MGEGREGGGFEGLVVTHWMCIAAPPTHSELLLRLVARPACAQRQADFKKQGGGIISRGAFPDFCNDPIGLMFWCLGHDELLGLMPIDGKSGGRTQHKSLTFI